MPLHDILRPWRVVGGIAGMAFVSQLINFGFSLVLPRLYTDVSFGEFGLFLAIVLIVAEMINLRLDIALNTVRDREDAFGICRVAILSGIIISFVAGVLLSLVKWIFPQIIIHPLPVVLALILYAIYQPTFWMLNREGNFAAISIFRVVQAIITGVVTIGFIWLKFPINGLIYGFCSGLAVASLGQWWIVYRAAKKFFGPTVNPPILKTIQRFKQFWQYGTWSALFNNISRQLPIYFLQRSYGLAPAGQYTMGTRLINAPVWTISGALGQYFVKEAIHKNNEELLKWVRKTIFFGLGLAVLPSVILFFWGEEIFAFLFGAEWTEAGRMVQWLMPWYMFSFAIGPTTQALDLRGKLRFEFVLNGVTMVSRATALGIGWLLGSYETALILFASVGVIVNLWQWYYIENMLKQPDGGTVATEG